MNDFRSHYAAHGSNNTAAYEGVDELLTELKARGVKMAIATNKYQQAAEALRKRFFADTIDIIVGDGEGRKRKPAADIALAALERLGVGRDGAVYVGDTDVDLQTAEAAGLPCICVSWGYRSREELVALGAAAIADTPAQLLELL